MLARSAGRGRELRGRQLDHAMIDQPHQSELLGDRDHRARRHDGAVGAQDAHQAFVERGLARAGLDDRLEGEHDAPLVQRRDDLVGRLDVFLAHRIALDVRPVGDERAAPLGLGGIERFLRVRENFIDRARMTRRRDRRRS